MANKEEAPILLWHKPEEEPDRSREPIVRLHRDGSAGTLFFHMMRDENEVEMMMFGIIAWAYLDELLGDGFVIFDEEHNNSKKTVLWRDEIDFKQ